MALVLAIGIVVDDAIVMLENIVRIELGENPLVAAYKGAKQVLICNNSDYSCFSCCFVPLIFIKGSRAFYSLKPQ